MIPKTIHYCWFGGNPLSEISLRCIESWKKYCPECEIHEWNESNFDLDCCDYVKEAYSQKKWAFVSDYARFSILYQYGGIYFDTDVELIRPIDDILSLGPYMGCEKNSVSLMHDSKNVVNPGLGLAATPGLELYKEILDEYEKRHFIKEDRTQDKTTVVSIVTNILKQHGYKSSYSIQYIKGISIYPPDYFSPMDYATGIINIAKETRSIHHYTASWHSEKEKHHHAFGQKMCRLFGIRIGNMLESLYSFPYQFNQKYQVLGLKSTILFLLKRILKK